VRPYGRKEKEISDVVLKKVRFIKEKGGGGRDDNACPRKGGEPLFPRVKHWGGSFFLLFMKKKRREGEVLFLKDPWPISPLLYEFPHSSSRKGYPTGGKKSHLHSLQ